MFKHHVTTQCKETPTHLINMQTHINASLLSHQIVVHALCPICLKEILAMCIECEIMKHITPHDVILADRSFRVQDLVNPLQAAVKISSFLEGRSNLSATEELSTRKNANAIIHVNRFNECVKSFRLVGRKIPLSLPPLATQMVMVACGLVNFQGTFCK